MKKHVLFALALATVAGSYAQNKKLAVPAAGIANKAVLTTKGKVIHDDVAAPFNKSTPLKNGRPNYPSHAALKNGGGNTVNAATENIVGNTDYDLQTNSSTFPRLYMHSDGTMSAGWTFVPDGGTSGADRGTGYNYYDGSAWGPFPTARIEGAERTGFINIVGTASGQEASFGHSSTTFSVLYTSRPAKGTGTWNLYPNALKTNATDNTDTWARVVSGGANGNSIHCIVNTNDQGTAGGTIIYSRSEDDGATWNILRDTIPGLGAGSYPYFIGGDAYNIATRGNTVAIVVGDLTTDIVLFKSTDNGTSWTKTAITNNFPGGSYNPDGQITDFTTPGVADTVTTTGGDVNVTIDYSGVCHVFWGNMRIMDDNAVAGNTDFSYWPGTNGIWYWHEGMTTPVIAAGAEDWNNNGFLDLPSVPDPTWTDPNESPWGQYGNMGFSCVPAATIDAAGNIYLSFMALDEAADTTLYYKAHYQVYLTTSSDNGVNWTAPYNLITAGGAGQSDSLSYDGAYPSIADKVDGSVHVIYQRDYAPGIAAPAYQPGDAANNDPNNGLNDIVVVNVPITDPGVLGVHDLGSNITSFQVTQNNPNPFNGTSTFNVTLKSTSDVTVEIVNTIGQVMQSNKYDRLASGTHQMTLDATQLSAGVYYYTVKVGAEKVTNKMIVK